MKSLPAPSRRSHGFTIIEVIIVLALVGVIILIIILAVPALQRNSRNYQRRIAVNYVDSMMEDYRTTHSGDFPYYGTAATDPSRVAFVNDLKTNGPAKQFDINYTDTLQSHKMPYDVGWQPSQDVIFIMPGHFCQRLPGYGPTTDDYPFQGSSATADDYRYFAVSIVLENGDHTSYCVDNSL